MRPFVIVQDSKHRWLVLIPRLHDYVLAKLYAKIGSAERSLEYLRKALEEGYKNVNDVYKDPEFAMLRKDTRFTALMAAKPQSIPE